MAVNEALVGEGLRLLRTPLSLHICRTVEKQCGERWWTEGILETLIHDKAPTVEDVRKYRKLPESGSLEDCASAMDLAACLVVLTKQWFRIDGLALGRDHRGWAYELMGVRNENKHLGAADHDSDFAWRALDTMYQLCSAIDTEVAAEIRQLRSSVDLSMYGQRAGAVQTPVATEAPNPLVVAPVTPSPREAALEDLADELVVAGPDFSGADLRKMNFAGANLSGADFTDANLTDANFKGSVLKGAIFKGAVLGNADLTQADLGGAMFEGTTLSVTRDEGPSDRYVPVARGADFTGATTEGAKLNFAGADLKRVNFSGVNLAGADFTDANLVDANFKGAVLSRAIFKNADLGNADLSEADLSNAVFDGTTLSVTRDEGPRDRYVPVARGADFTGATTEGAKLNFAGADLKRVNFSGVNLAGADFTDANLVDANFKGAVLSRAILKNADLGNADLSEADLSNAVFDGTTLSVTRDEGPLDRYVPVTRGADFTGATTEGATLNFAGADLRKVNLSNVDLTGADFAEANLEGADLRGATLRGVNLKGANIKDANTTDVRWT